MELIINHFIFLAFCVNAIRSLNVTCSNLLNSYDAFDDICYVKEVHLSLEDNEKIDFLVSYTTPDKINIVDIFTDDKPGIDYIPTEVFDFFTNLRVLRVNSKVKAILPGDLQKGGSLTSLGVSNQLQKISKDIFSANVNLESLSLYSNQISEIEDNAFEELKELFSLELQNNQITEIRRRTFVGLDKLHVLNLYENQIRSIEDFSFEQLPKLEHLTLHRNKLKTLSDNVFVGLIKLREITLQNNQLNRIHNSLYGLHAAETIDLSFNAISDLDPVEFAKLPNLTNLKLFDSGFSSNETTKV